MTREDLNILDMTVDSFRQYVNLFEDAVSNFQRQIDRIVQIEGMKAENAARVHAGNAPAYVEQHFNGV